MLENCIQPKIYEVFNNEAFDFFEQEGYVIVKLDIDINILKGARNTIQKIAKIEENSGDACFYENRNKQEGNISTTKKKLQRIWNILNKDKIFHNFPLCNNHINALNKIFSRKTSHSLYSISSFQANILYPGAEKQKIHLDTPVPEPLPSWPLKVNTINLLDDFTEFNGATMIAPRSHKLRIKPKPGTKDEKKLKKVIAPFGSFIITHGGLWHSSGKNISDVERIVILGSYAASYAREIAYEENHLQIKNESMAFSNYLKELLGYDIEPKPGSCNFRSF